MARYANADQRKSLIASLRSLAEFLEAHPDVPTHQWLDVMVFPNGTDEQQRAEVDKISALIGGQVIDQRPGGGYYVASRHFGPVEYRAIAIPRDHEREGE